PLWPLGHTPRTRARSPHTADLPGASSGKRSFYSKNADATRQPFQPMLSVGLARVERFRPPAGQTTWVVGFVLWPIGLALLATGVPFAVSGRRIRRRARLGLCAACGYDRRGLESGAACPECGKGK
ncbi:MAG: hypothetical protein AABZ53_08050, partial [Planctomycetota bacterium]